MLGVETSKDLVKKSLCYFSESGINNMVDNLFKNKTIQNDDFGKLTLVMAYIFNT